MNSGDNEFNVKSFLKEFFKICFDDIEITIYKLFNFLTVFISSVSLIIAILYGIYLSVGAAIAENKGIMSSYDFINLSLNNYANSHFFKFFSNLIQLCIFSFLFT
jgi:hypothetical protein